MPKETHKYDNLTLALMPNQSISISQILFLVGAVAVYSASSLFNKLASMHEMMSIEYLLFLGGSVAVLGVYAVLWQIILKRIPLSTAYPFRSLGIVYGLVIAGGVFGETVSLQNIIGAAMVIVGVLIISTEKN